MRPDAAHVPSTLSPDPGGDDIGRGADAIWHGPTQPVPAAVRASRKPGDPCGRLGRPRLTPVTERQTPAGDAARVCGVDLDQLCVTADTDELSWTNQALAHHGSAADRATDEEDGL